MIKNLVCPTFLPIPSDFYDRIDESLKIKFLRIYYKLLAGFPTQKPLIRAN